MAKNVDNVESQPEKKWVVGFDGDEPVYCFDWDGSGACGHVQHYFSETVARLAFSDKGDSKPVSRFEMPIGIQIINKA